MIIKLRTNVCSEKATGVRWAWDAVPVETMAPVVRPEAAAVQGRERSHLVCVLGPIRLLVEIAVAPDRACHTPASAQAAQG